MVAAALGDGGLTKSGRMVVFYYTSIDNEQIDGIIKDINEVFGNVHTYSHPVGDKARALFICSAVIHDCSRRAGAAVGKKALLDPCLPSMVKYGSWEIRRAYLRQTFDDEGSSGAHVIQYYRAIDITRHLQPEQISYLESEMGWKTMKLPGGRALKYILIGNEEVKNQLKKTGI